MSKKDNQKKKLSDLPNKLEDYQYPDDQPKARKPLGGEEQRQALVEQRIQEAMDNGAFDNLPGAGKPLQLNENPYQQPGQAWTFDWLKRNNFAPEWVERNKAIERELETARTRMETAWQHYKNNPTYPSSWQAAVTRFEDTLRKINKKIDDYNLVAPTVSAQRKHIHLESELRRINACR